eukprot:m.448710 g.448710  ORF g.448710 m.448710 type:complete len:315 (+) comp20315_c14_seq49:1101-2045(+)
MCCLEVKVVVTEVYRGEFEGEHDCEQGNQLVPRQPAAVKIKHFAAPFIKGLSKAAALGTLDSKQHCRASTSAGLPLFFLAWATTCTMVCTAPAPSNPHANCSATCNWGLAASSCTRAAANLACEPPRLPGTILLNSRRLCMGDLVELVFAVLAPPAAESNSNPASTMWVAARNSWTVRWAKLNTIRTRPVAASRVSSLLIKPRSMARSRACCDPAVPARRSTSSSPNTIVSSRSPLYARVVRSRIASCSTAGSSRMLRLRNRSLVRPMRSSRSCVKMPVKLSATLPSVLCQSVHKMTSMTGVRANDASCGLSST